MSREKKINIQSGWGMLIIDLAMYVFTIVLFILTIRTGNLYGASPKLFVMIASLPILFIASIIVSTGFFILQPNEAGVILLFGEYKGTVAKEGFYWANPFFTKKKISLRLRNLNCEKLKVNDKAGNPIEIAAVIVWQVVDTFAALFDVDNYTDFVKIQSESALRHLASAYPYDSWEDEKAISLRGDIDQVSKSLEKELQERLIKAGVQVKEARLSHLAYAPEIAEAMLKRQQAGAIISARTKIVDGAVSMVEMALKKLSQEKIVEMDDERKAAMVSNLLVVLCGETNAQPVVNAGTLYH